MTKSYDRVSYGGCYHTLRSWLIEHVNIKRPGVDKNENSLFRGALETPTDKGFRQHFWYKIASRMNGVNVLL